MRGLCGSLLRAAAKAHLGPREAARRSPTVRAVFTCDTVSSKILLDGIYESRELAALAREVFPACQAGSTALDIGAHIGNHTVFFARHFRRVVAFEPIPAVAALLKFNTVEFGNAVHVVEAGLSEASAKLNFSVNDRNLGASRITDEATDTSIEVKALDDLVEELELQDVSFVKIDVEGHEDKVLAGARGLLESNGPIIALEGFYKTDPEKGACVFSMLCQFGYCNFYRLSDRRSGAARSVPRFLRRHRPLWLEQVDDVIGENHKLVIASKRPI